MTNQPQKVTTDKPSTHDCFVRQIRAHAVSLDYQYAHLITTSTLSVHSDADYHVQAQTTIREFIDRLNKASVRQIKDMSLLAHLGEFILITSRQDGLDVKMSLNLDEQGKLNTALQDSSVVMTDRLRTVVNDRLRCLADEMRSLRRARNAAILPPCPAPMDWWRGRMNHLTEQLAYRIERANVADVYAGQISRMLQEAKQLDVRSNAAS